MKGYRTYITLAVMILNKVLQGIGFVDYNSEQVAQAIDVILAVVAFLFRYKATK